MNISEISRELSNQAESVALKLFPRGKKSGSEWRVGDISGNPGDSMGIHLNGDKAGVWCDFATGESGDLIDLWAKVYHNGSLKEAMPDIKSYLGIRDESFIGYKVNYAKPPKPPCTKPKDLPLEYLKARGFTDDTITTYKVGADAHQIYFPFLRDGELIMCKWRSTKDKKTAPTTSGQEPCLFGWQAIPDDTRDIYITEGEFDAMAMYQMGYPALSVPFGGGSGNKQRWIDSEYDNLERFETIYLCLDTDEMGITAAKEIADRLGQERCLWVTLPEKDANECLKKHIDITDCIRKAKNFDPEVLKRSGEYTEGVIDKFHPPEGAEEFIPIPWDKVAGKLELRDSELSLWNGMNGSGKSQVLGYVAMRAIQQGKRVCIASMELKPEVTLYRLARQAASVENGIPSKEYIRAIMSRFSESLWIFHCVGTAKKDELLKTIRYARKRYGIELFVIDSLMKCGIAEDDYNGQKGFVDELCDLKNEISCHIAMVTHSRKKESERERPGKMDIRGATAVGDLADTIINIWRNKPKEEKLQKAEYDEDDDISEIEDMYDAFLRCDKQRNGEWEGSFGLYFDKNTFQYLEYKHDRPKPFMEWRKLEQV